jgi:hypothetical protein
VPVLMRTGFSPLADTGQSAALSCDDGVDVLVGGVGSGKSLPAAFKLLKWIRRYPTRTNGLPSDWFVLGPSLKTVVDSMFKKIHEADSYFERPIIDRELPGLADPRLLCVNGATIYGRSGTNPLEYKSYEIEGFWMDEASEQSLLAFAMAMSRERNASALRAIITTNPRLGWIWSFVKGVLPSGADVEGRDVIEAFQKIREVLDVRVHRWDVRKNTTNKAQVLDGISAVLDAVRTDLSRQEVGGLFLGGEIESKHFVGLDKAFGKTLRLGNARAEVVGVDLGQTVDWTWFVAMDQRGIVLAQDRFQGHSVPVPREEFYAYVLDRLLGFCSKWGARMVKIDIAMHGRAFAQALAADERTKRMGLEVEGYQTDSNVRKSEAINALDVSFSRGAIQVPSMWINGNGDQVLVDNVDTLRREIEELVIEESSSGRVSYDHCQGGHDDGVVALALAWQGLVSKPRLRRRGVLSKFRQQQGLATDKGSRFTYRSGR